MAWLICECVWVRKREIDKQVDQEASLKKGKERDKEKPSVLYEVSKQGGSMCICASIYT